MRPLKREKRKKGRVEWFYETVEAEKSSCGSIKAFYNAHIVQRYSTSVDKTIPLSNPNTKAVKPDYQGFHCFFQLIQLFSQRPACLPSCKQTASDKRSF